MTERYQLLPDLAGDDYDRLRTDIAARGVLVPVEVDEDGVLLDGHHRQRIADELGIDCPRVVRSGMAEHEKRLHAVALNLARRQLTDGQKVILGQRIAPDVAEAARLRMLATQNNVAARAVEQPATTVTGRSEDEVARLVGLGSGRTFERAVKVVERAEQVAPELYERIANGQAEIRVAVRELRAVTKAERVAEIAAAPVAALPGGETFPVLYVDPPWRYDGVETPDARQVENHYPTMSFDELTDMELPAADDSVLFCWATSPKLREALDLFDAWGFDYRTCMVWVKDRIGMGYYARQQHELLLIGKRGDLPVPDPAARPSSVIQAPRAAHSAKPVEVYELIERMYPQYRRCELFARTAREGWAGWGNQAVAS